MDSDEHSDVIQLGVDAYYAGVEFTQNPYTEDTDESKQKMEKWSIGWQLAADYEQHKCGMIN